MVVRILEYFDQLGMTSTKSFEDEKIKVHLELKDSPLEDPLVKDSPKQKGKGEPPNHEPIPQKKLEPEPEKKDKLELDKKKPAQKIQPVIDLKDPHNIICRHCFKNCEFGCMTFDAVVELGTAVCKVCRCSMKTHEVSLGYYTKEKVLSYNVSYD